MIEAEGRIGWGAVGVGVVGVLGVLLFPPERLALARAVAVGLGVGISLLNYAWLRAGVEAMLRGTGSWGAARFLLRFWLSAACLYAIFITHLVPFAWVLAGLFAVPAAALGEGVRQLIFASDHA